MNIFVLKIVRILPLLTLTFTVLVFCVTIYVDYTNTSCVIFIFMSVEVYVNWLAIYLTRYTDADSQESTIINSTTHKNNSVVLDLKPMTSCMTYTQKHDYSKRSDFTNKNIMNQDISLHNVDIRKIWYCSKCMTNSPFSCDHCPLCSKCIIHRDHHCFFLGACICLKNMGHFIILCIYAGLASMYVDICLFPHLYDHFEKQEGAIPSSNLISRCFFPVALGKWLLDQEDFLFLSLVALFDILLCTSICTFGFGMYNLYLALTGQSNLQMKGSMKYHKLHFKVSLMDLKNNFTIMFGKWGAVNFIIPVALLENLLHLKYFRGESKYN